MTILNNIQAREYNRAQQLKNFFEENAATCAKFIPFNKEVSLFFDNNKQLSIYIPVKAENGEGITTTKKELKTSVALQVNTICTLMLAYAAKIGDKDLEAAVNFRYSKVSKMKDADVLGVVNSVVAVIKPLLSDEAFADYAITEEALDSVIKDATAFNNIIGKATLIDNKSSLASKNINAILKTISANVAQFNLLISFFKKDDPDFVDGFLKSAAINESGIRHSGITGIVTIAATGAPIEGAVICTADKTKETKTSLLGAYSLIKMKAGNVKIEVSAPGFATQTFIIKIIRGKILPLNIAF